MFWCVNMMASLKDAMLGPLEGETRNESLEHVEMEMQEGMSKLSRSRSKHRWRNVFKWMQATYTSAPNRTRQQHLQEKFHQERRRKSASADSLLPTAEEQGQFSHRSRMVDNMRSLSMDCVKPATPATAPKLRAPSALEVPKGHMLLRRSSSVDALADGKPKAALAASYGT